MKTQDLHSPILFDFAEKVLLICFKSLCVCTYIHKYLYICLFFKVSMPGVANAS